MAKKTGSFAPNDSRIASALLVLLVLACHGLVLINHGVFVDGWVLYGLYLNRDVSTMHVLFGQIGIPILGWFHLAFWHAPDPIFAYKLVSFTCILLSTLCVHSLARRMRILSTRESLFAAAMFCCYTAYQLHVEIDVVQYTFCYALFLLGACLALCATEAGGKTARMARAASLLLFFISFQTASLLVFYLAFLILLFIERRREWLGRNLPGLIKSALRYWDFIFLPIAYWLLRMTVFKPYGEFAHGNVLRFEPRRWPELFGAFLDNAIAFQFSAALAMLRVSFHARPSLYVPLMISGIAVVALFGRRLRREYLGALYIALYAAGMLLCATAPYILVNKFPSYTGFETRHALLVNLPIAIGLVALGRIFSLALPRTMASLILPLLAGLLIGGFALSTLAIYEEYQARWIKDLSVIANLRRLPRETIDKVRVIIVSDPDRIGSETYRFYEYAGMFKLAWREERRAGVDPSRKTSAAAAEEWESTLNAIKSERTYPMYMLKDLPAEGCRAVLNIGLNIPDRKRLMLSYFKRLWFHPERVQAFLESATTLTLTDLSCPD